MQRRNKVGGILDRRIGENDPTMAPEERALQRYAMEIQRSHKKSSIFDLEEDEQDVGLTHLGKSLLLDDESAVRDDFDEPDLLSDDSDLAHVDRNRLKRMRGEEYADGENEAENEMPERKKTKQEVMKELISKSKFYKYERQAAKEEDEALMYVHRGSTPLLTARADIY